MTDRSPATAVARTVRGSSAAVLAGAYKVSFADDSGKFVDQNYNNKPNLAAADPVSARSATAGVGARLAASLGSVAGVVTDAATGLPLRNQARTEVGACHLPQP